MTSGKTNMTLSMASGPRGATLLNEFSGLLVLVGAGRMGAAMLEGWLGLGLDPARVVVIEPQPSREVGALASRGLQLNPAAEAVHDASAIVIAVKPQRTLPASTAIIRTMPNLPASIGRGITVAVANARVTPHQRGLAGRLLGATGAVEWVEDEALLDAVTAVSGSGPAYVFWLAECLARAGAAAGLPTDLAARLARATVAGSGELLARSDLDAGDLRRNVTSPGGTTAAALEILMAPDAFAPLMERAVAAATRRAGELAG
jgi:pyrroline-5-carboxylate reductase